jgi:hypothetical protein
MLAVIQGAVLGAEASIAGAADVGLSTVIDVELIGVGLTHVGCGRSWCWDTCGYSERAAMCFLR